MITRKSLVASVLGACLGLGLTFSPVGVANAATPQNQFTDFQFQQELSHLNNVVRAHKLVLSNLKIEQAGPSSMYLTGSCTVSATVSVPGGTGVTISATASTCAEAAQMVAEGIAEVEKQISKLSPGGN